jgi:hypothetical protein
MDATPKNANGRVRRVLGGLLGVLRALPLVVVRLLAGIGLILLLVALVIILTNAFISVPYNVAFRALDPNSPACRSGEPWMVLAEVGNDEWRAIERKTDQGKPVDWEERLRCSIQTHAIPGYEPREGFEVGAAITLAYDLAFLEFQENGDPYVLCDEREYEGRQCDGDFRPTPGGKELHRSQLDALLDRLSRNGDRNYVVVFVHGWRNTADIGNGNVADLRTYAAHAARNVVDRCIGGDARFCGMKVTAIYVGWRGARTDEARLTNWGSVAAKPFCGAKHCWVNSVFENWAAISAVFTLFDRKPVSETIAPSVISALRAVESGISLQDAFSQVDLAPCEFKPSGKDPLGCSTQGDNNSGPQSRMIVFGHSLGGNVLATGLRDTAVKEVDRHVPGDFVPSPLGNLVVLINPASEAAKWTAIQRAVWNRIAMYNSDKGRDEDQKQGALFFRAEQRPVLVSVTSARDWPPDGIWPSDCADLLKLVGKKLPEQDQAILQAFANEVRRRNMDVEYDWATYDAFPAFRFDFRPLASSLEQPSQVRPELRYAHTAKAILLAGCASSPPASAGARITRGLSAVLRTFPFMNTDVEQTHTIGQLDPPRSVQSLTSNQGVSARPVGTTHQLVGWSSRGGGQDPSSANKMERTRGYVGARDQEDSCPQALHWLSQARDYQYRHYDSLDQWDAADVERGKPALHFQHGYYPAHLPPITHGYDPFWNMRVLDDALTAHDGYMLSSFICAMQQLVLDDITVISRPVGTPHVNAPPPKP